ncbi:hypothetical protein [Kutzneria sp. NPDC052558]|uniref:hypothetical protein n=1 Tax=Kutzneria sp. NPDC052558 TaxID=3364121 RepID=UPI0037CB0346
MPRHAAVLAALALALAGCGTTTPAAQPPSTAPTTTSTTTSSTPTTTSAPRIRSHRPVAPPTSRVTDCFDGDCTLLLTAPTTIPLDNKTFHYPSMTVTAISADSLTYSLTIPEGGGASTTIGPGLAGGSFGFRDSPSIEVGLTVVDGTPALILQPADPL